MSLCTTLLLVSAPALRATSASALPAFSKALCVAQPCVVRNLVRPLRATLGSRELQRILPRQSEGLFLSSCLVEFCADVEEPAVPTSAMRTNWPSLALPLRLSFVKSLLRIRMLRLKNAQIIRSLLDSENSHYPPIFGYPEQSPRDASISGAIAEIYSRDL